VAQLGWIVLGIIVAFYGAFACVMLIWLFFSAESRQRAARWPSETEHRKKQILERLAGDHPPPPAEGRPEER